MDNSIYITLSRQLALFRDMDITANNIANANTTGYTTEHINFRSYLVRDINQGNHNRMAFAHDISSYRDTSPGSLKTTGNPLDIAIDGSGYFAIQTPLGIRYSRAGNFQISSEGTLINAQGFPVLDDNNQQIIFPENAIAIEIGSIGNIKVDGEDFGTLNVAQFENEQLLEPAGHNLFKTDIAPLPSGDIPARVVHGILEGSNVTPITEMTHMIKVSRSVGSTAKFVEVMYDLQRKASNTWAKQG